METRLFIFMLLVFITVTSLHTRADSSDSDSCEDSDSSSSYETLCQQYLRLTKCKSNMGPVCGTNGVTYRNEYYLARAACPRGRERPTISRQYEGFCLPPPPPVTTPPALIPTEARTTTDPCDIQCPTGPVVCGTDGVVYQSECHLERSNCRTGLSVAVRNVGVCLVETTTETVTTPATTPAPAPTTMPTTQAPTTMMTTTLPTETRRTPPDIGGRTPEPGRGDTPCNSNCPPGNDGTRVCGSDGQTYESECHLLTRQCAVDRSLEVAFPRPCAQPQGLCPPTSDCPQQYLPICGSDNVTYPSLCHFQIAACVAKDDTRKVVLAGECQNADSQSNCPQCPSDVQEVCGTDNVTYSSECSLQEIACRNSIDGLMTAYVGRCQNQECPDMCRDIVDPICASNGKTYISICALSVEVCRTKDPTITVAHRGQCTGNPCEVDCPDIYEPLCDDQGTTYQNACQLWIAICLDPDLSRRLDNDGCNLAIP